MLKIGSIHTDRVDARQLICIHRMSDVSLSYWTSNNNKKYVLWNMGICPIASKVGHVTLATPPFGSFIVPYVVLDMAYPTKKRRV